MARADCPGSPANTGPSAAARSTAAVRLLARLLGIAQLTPRALAALQASLVRWLIMRRSCLRHRGVDVQHERIDVPAQRGDDERHPLRHQAGDERDVTAEPVELRHGDFALAFFAAFSAAFSCGRRSSASLPLPVSTSVNSATISKPSASANAGDGLALGFEAETRAALLLGGDAVIGDDWRHRAGFHYTLTTVNV